MKAGKVWGHTQQILANGVTELHRVSVNKGATCSEHCHQSKWNGFLVIAGKLKIKTWKNAYPLCDETTLGPGEFCQVPPGEYHQFEALEDTDALELYWVGLDASDIQRRSQGAA